MTPPVFFKPSSRSVSPKKNIHSLAPTRFLFFSLGPPYIHASYLATHSYSHGRHIPIRTLMLKLFRLILSGSSYPSPFLPNRVYAWFALGQVFFLSNTRPGVSHTLHDLPIPPFSEKSAKMSFLCSGEAKRLQPPLLEMPHVLPAFPSPKLNGLRSATKTLESPLNLGAA